MSKVDEGLVVGQKGDSGGAVVKTTESAHARRIHGKQVLVVDRVVELESLAET